MIKMPNVYGPINHLLKHSTTFRWMPNTDDSTDGGLRWFYTPAEPRFLPDRFELTELN